MIQGACGLCLNLLNPSMARVPLLMGPNQGRYMNNLIILTLLLFNLAGCEKSLNRPEGYEPQWPQRQEQMEREKHEDIKHLDQERQEEERSREVNVDHSRTIDPIKLNPGND
jgi:hypothetical protein